MTPGPLLRAFNEDPTELLTPEDREWISDVYAEGVPDPGFRSLQELGEMTARDRERYRRDRTRYLRMAPLFKTAVVTDVLEKLEVFAESSTASTHHQQDVQILNGDPGVGKTMLVKTHAAEEMERLAMERSLDLEDGVAKPLSTFRPVVYTHLQGPMTRHDVIRLLCAELGWPTDRNPIRAFEQAVHKCGIELVVIDEIQHVNFAGKTGRDVHNIIRWMSNIGLRVILAGTDADWVLNGGGTPAVEVAARNSRGRWIRIEVPKLEMDTQDDHDEWRDLVFAFEGRLRLAAAPSNPGWLADTFGTYMWSRTQGYLNSLVLLVNLAAATAIQTGAETIDRAMLDSIDLEYEVEQQRPQRMAMFDSGTYPVNDL